MKWIDELLKDPVGASLIDTQSRNVRFTISPSEFKRADIMPRLNWQSVEFTKSSKSMIPMEPGLYAFVVRIPFDGLPPHGWVMYIGQTGGGKSGATLQSRFGEYLANKKKPKNRPKVYYMLNAWDGSLAFYFAPEINRKERLEELETQLLGAFRPPFTDRTYPASYMSPGNAF
ncbi:MAG: hypothetical protein LBV44_07285 [Methylobacillus sp.]|jgi:hypothetical protein|nr:hypothetical protein [Methylobacillus sp.]